MRLPAKSFRSRAFQQVARLWLTGQEDSARSRIALASLEPWRLTMRKRNGIVLGLIALLAANGMAWGACWNSSQAGPCTNTFCECIGRTQAACTGDSWLYRGSNASANHCYAAGTVVGAGIAGFTGVLGTTGGCGTRFIEQTTCTWWMQGGGGGSCGCAAAIGGAVANGQLDSSTCTSCTGVALAPLPVDLTSPLVATVDGIPVKILR